MSDKPTNAAKAILDVHLSGALLQVIAERIATGRIGTPLRIVIKEAEELAAQAKWTKRLRKMMGAW